MDMKKILPFLVLGELFSRKSAQKIVIKTYPVEQSKEIKHEWSKRTQQKMKGKKARKNRGKLRAVAKSNKGEKV